MDKSTLIQRFQERNELRLDTYCYLPDPRTIHDMGRLTRQGGYALRHITELKAIIETLEAYQQLLFDRAQDLTTASYNHEIHLTRHKRYDNKVHYYLEVKKVYDVPGIDPEILERTQYPGTERHKALKDFTAYQKSHPGIIAVKDIAKSRWER